MIIYVEHSTCIIFKENDCSSSDSSVRGGGMYISFNGRFHTFNVTIKHNCAQLLGGLCFFSYHTRNLDHSNKVETEACVFQGNEAHIGSAIDITP